MAKYNDRPLGHAGECDGIEEYDNPLPDWWVGLFILTVIIGVIYAADYHFISQRSQAASYEAEVAMAEEMWPELNAKAVQASDPATLAMGQEVFTANCVACHGADLRGGIGVNLVDTEWVHGGEFDNVVNTITNGVSAKGMPAWGTILGPTKVAAVASFVLSKNTGEAPAAKAAPAAEPEAAAEGGEAVAEAEVIEVVVDEAHIAAGEAVFTTNCVACHLADMTGSVGPNLVDDEWIHGGEIADIQKTVTEGVPAKGMITWKGVLSDQEIADVTAYVYSKSHPAE